MTHNENDCCNFATHYTSPHHIVQYVSVPSYTDNTIIPAQPTTTSTHLYPVCYLLPNGNLRQCSTVLRSDDSHSRLVTSSLATYSCPRQCMLRVVHCIHVVSSRVVDTQGNLAAVLCRGLPYLQFCHVVPTSWQ